MNKSSTIRLLRTEPHSCSYLKDAIATTEFVSPDDDIDLQTYQFINDAGFRRSGAHFYRPQCESCTQCKPLRVLVEEFSPSKSQKRILKKNAGFNIRIASEPDPESYFLLYKNYILERHPEGDMCPPDREQFDNFICTTKPWTRFIEFFTSDSNNESTSEVGADANNELIDHEPGQVTEKLTMVAVCDFLPSGLSAIYSFFDPAQSGSSLGTYAILAQIDIASQIGVPYLYLGYWIEESEKMNYKNRFIPCEILENDNWRTISF